MRKSRFTEARRLKALEDENNRLKGMLADAMLDNPSSFLTAAGKAQAAGDFVLLEMGVE